MIPGRIAVADYDGDGRLDFAVGSPGRVQIFLGNGAGTFLPPRQVLFDGDATALVAGDLDNDGRDDLVVSGAGAPASGARLRVLRNVGGASFQIDYESSGVPGTSGSLLLADVDGSGFLDLVVGSSMGDVEVLRNSGDGRFGPPTSVHVGQNVSGLAAGDLNHDGRVDIVAATVTETSQIVILLSDVGGRLREAQTLPFFGNPIVTDFDGDGFDDVVSTGALFAPSFASMGGLFPGNGDGTVLVAPVVATGFASQMSLADLNADGRADLVWLSPAGFGGMISDGAGGFSDPVFTTLTDSLQEVVFADVTGDGRADAVSLSSNHVDFSWRLSVRPGIGNGGFGADVVTPLPSYPVGLVLADFDGDGRKDAALYLNRQLVVARGDGQGAFSFPNPPQTIPFGSLLAADLNGDGRADLVLTEGLDRIVVLLNEPTGSFRVSADLSIFSTTAALVDVDGDGKTDLMTTTTQSVLVRKGDGAGNFGAPRETAMQLGGGFAAADFDGDGRLDLIAGIPATVYKGRDDGSFAMDVSFPLAPGYWLAGDLTGDGKPDVLGTLGENTYLIRNTTCETRRLQVDIRPPSCGVAGTIFEAQPSVRVLDDAGNLVTCESGQVTASLVPSSSASGARLSGITSVPVSGGVARFSNLSIDKGGGGYRLRFELAGSRTTATPKFSQSLPAPVIVGPTQICSRSSTLFDGGAGGDSWAWTLDGAIVGTERFLTLPGIAFGTHTLGLVIREDACTSTSSISILVSAPPCPREPHKPAQPPVPGFPVSPRPLL